MIGKRYTEEFKVGAVKQVTDRDHPAAEVAERLGVSIPSIYAWTKHYRVPVDEPKAQDVLADEVKRLKAELKRVTDERDILRKAAAYYAKTSGKVRLDSSASSDVFSSAHVQDAENSSQRLRRLARQLRKSACEGTSAPARTHQAVVAGKRRGVWVSQDLRRFARAR